MQEVTVIKGDPLVFSLAGEIDSENSDEFYEEVMASYEPSPANVVFECARLKFIDSTTLGVFVKIFKRLKADGFGLKLKALRPQLKKLFVICALDSVMEIEE